MRRFIAFVLIGLVLTASISVEAATTVEAEFPQDPSSPEPPLYKSGLRRDAPILGAGAVLLGAALLWGSNGKTGDLNKACPVPGCNTSPDNGLDDRFAGRLFRPGPHKLSNVLEATAIAAPFLLDGIEVSRHGLGRREFLRDSLVQGEILLVNHALTEMAKRIVWRPRPFAYQPAGEELQEQDTYRSFYSGHTSNAFAMSVGYAMAYARRHPSGKKKLALGIAIGFGTTIGALRIAAHKHFPTDVIAGAMSGMAVGVAVPALH